MSTPPSCPNDCDFSELWELLRSIDKKLDLHLQEHTITKPQLDSVLETFHQSKGVITLVRALVYIIAPLLLVGAWVKDHIKL